MNTMRGLVLLVLLVSSALVRSQHTHGNPSTSGNPDGDISGSSMKYKDAGFRFAIHADGWHCDENLITPDGPSASASSIVLERPQNWDYYHPFRLFYCGITSVMPVAYQMRIEIQDKSIAQHSMADGYHQSRTFNYVANVCYGEHGGEPICWDKIRQQKSEVICLKSGSTTAHFNFYFPGSGEHVRASVNILCNGTDYDRLYWENPAWGHWLPGGAPFIGYSILLLFELGILKSNNYKTAGDVKQNRIGHKRKSVEIESSSDTNSGEDNPADLQRVAIDDNDHIIVPNRSNVRSYAFIARGARRVKHVAKQIWITLGFENFILVGTGLGVVVAHIPTGNIAWSDPFNLMHLMLGGTMLMMGFIGTMFNTRYLRRITFNFTVSLTLIMLGVMMKFHEQEEGLIGLVHDAFTYGIVISGLCRIISAFVPTFQLLFIVTGLFATFTFALGSPAWMITFTSLGIMHVTFIIFTGFMTLTWVCFWVFVGLLLHKRREASGYHSLNGASIPLQNL